MPSLDKDILSVGPGIFGGMEVGERIDVTSVDDSMNSVTETFTIVEKCTKEMKYLGYESTGFYFRIKKVEKEEADNGNV